MKNLEEHLEEIARVPVLLVACDYDGTLAPIVEDPRKARAHPASMVALRTLSALPQTHVAVISGRALRDLAALTGFPDEVHLVGSHGSEFDPDFHRELPEKSRRLKERIKAALEQIAGEGNGFYIEEKPASVAFHYRNAPPEKAAEALETISRGPAALAEVHVHHGKKVMELAVLETNKGDALESIRRRVGASAAIFLGDDTTDEDAFATLRGPDMAVKVGDGPTRAAYRVPDHEAVARLLARLSELRQQWLESTQFVPIEHHAMLTDQRTAALVTPDARIVWMCAPRLDASALFAEVLGGPGAGHFAVRPASGEAPRSQRYHPRGFVLETRWSQMTVTDCLDCTAGRPMQRAGRTDLVRVLEGRGEVEITFAPRLDFGRIPTRLRQREDGLEIEDTPDPIVLFAPGVTWTFEREGPHQTAHGRVTLGRTPQVLELRCGTGSLKGTARAGIQRVDGTRRYWAGWSDDLSLPVVERELVGRSALVLKGLCYEPTGAFAAAATTSLPEHVGGVRNWDYRYCWLRDGAMSAASLVRLGSTREAIRFLDWLLDIVDNRCESPERLCPVYTLTGHELPAEAEISELPGYRGSRPVRIGNAASRQIQLDVFGPVVDLIHQLVLMEAPLTPDHWRLVEAMVAAVQRRWREPDHGIWELRTGRRHHVHSKVMCWVTVDRGIAVAADHMGKHRDDWVALRDEIAAHVLENGWNPEVGAFTTAYGSGDVDAAVLEIGLRGLIPPDDPRFLSTIEAVERSLREGPVVYRYRFDDGLPGFEGGFHLCTSWLIQAYLRIGRTEEAHALFRDLVALAGPTGLLSEQWSTPRQLALGNHPQAFSHIGIIDAAVALSDA